MGSAHKESSFNISAWEYAAPMTIPELPDLADTDLDAAGRVRQNGEADLLWLVSKVARDGINECEAHTLSLNDISDDYQLKYRVISAPERGTNRPAPFPNQGLASPACYL